MSDGMNRRDFLKKSSAAGIGLGVMGGLSPMIAQGQPNKKLTVAVMGLNGRGGVLCRSFAGASNCEVKYVADPDEDTIPERVEQIREIQGKAPKGIKDFRDALDDRDVDILAIAAPDHWHTPASIMALQAGKHVYVEKPCGHNPREGELLIAAQKKYKKVVQMGNQQRSALKSIQCMEDIDDGIIGDVYYARAFYANDRGSIGNGKVASPPANLDWDLWQGPAPRIKYRDNLVHYNWHWFWRWGTGESCNNGTHEIDVARWALGVDFPKKVHSSGGRYHFDDDWEFYDTQVLTFDFEGDKTIQWEGKSCNPFPVTGRGRGTTIHGTEGSIVIDRDGYIVYDMDNNEVKNVTGDSMSNAMDTAGGGNLTDMHIENFNNAIRESVEPHSPIEEGHKSVLLCHLGNIAQEMGRQLNIDTLNGRILDDKEAMKMWGREYEIGWEPKI
jgi:predicted dehydrogenase